jgi:hypothetical protein
MDESTWGAFRNLSAGLIVAAASLSDRQRECRTTATKNVTEVAENASDRRFISEHSLQF